MGKPTFDLCYSEDDVLRGTPLGCRRFVCGLAHGQDVFGLAEITKKVFVSEYIGYKSKPGELKHLSTRRKGHQRDSVSSGERTRTRPVLLFDEPERPGKVGLSG